MDSRQTNRKIVKDFPLSNETKTVISLSLSFMEIYALIKREKATQMWLSAVSPMCVENWTKETPSTTTRNRNNKDHYFIASWQRMMRGFPHHTLSLENFIGNHVFVSKPNRCFGFEHCVSKFANDMQRVRSVFVPFLLSAHLIRSLALLNHCQPSMPWQF